jgi:uncharacterized protein YuzE
MAALSVHVGSYEFDHVIYDKDGDVLYLSTGTGKLAADTLGSPEGHAVCLDEHGEVIGITIVNTKWLLERNGGLRVTGPSPMETDPDDLARALAAA